MDVGTPREDGFRMPAEWAPHRRCWMAWPCRRELWGERLDAARVAYAAVAKAIADFEPVTMIARPELTAEVSLHCGQGVRVAPMPHDDSWTRDVGPSFLLSDDRRLAGVHWRFNAWGGLYADFEQDADLARAILERIEAPRYEGPLVLEGGGVHVDGEGTALVCEPTVLDPLRNPGVEREGAERVLSDFLGIRRVIWLPFGLVDDHTGGHVDNVACFARPGVVLAMSAKDAGDANHERLKANLEVLRAATDAAGRSLEVVAIEQPRKVVGDDGRRLSLSYVNLYVANGGVVMPAFGDSQDNAAYKAVAAAFPEREVVQVDALDLCHGGGGIHCITLQQPDPQPPAEA
jgi:agmatine deiminase